MTYFEKLKDPRWQKKRLQILDRDNFCCTQCAGTSEQLHVHHLVYKGSNPWDTGDEYLTTLCKNCHDREEKMVKKVKEIINNYTLCCGTIEPIYDYLLKFEDYAE